MSTNLELINTSLTLGAGDVVDYDNTGNLLIRVGASSSIELGTHRQSLRSNHVIEMAGGRISGTGSESEDCLLGLDFYDGGRINVTADSTIDTNVGGHKGGAVVFDVSAGVTLTMTGDLQSNGTYKKSNNGTMLYKGGAFTRDLEISGGVFEYYTESDITHTAAISGAGSFTKSGTGTLTLSGDNTYSGGTTVDSGKLVVDSAGAIGTGKVTVNKGAVLEMKAMPNNWTATDLLNGKVTGTGRVRLTSSASVASDITFAGELEVTGKGVIFTIDGGQDNYKDFSSLSNLVVNNGAQIYYHATPDTRNGAHLQKLSVESGTGDFYIRDTDTQNRNVVIGVAAVSADATLTLTSEWQDSGITINKLEGLGKLDVYSPNNSSQRAEVSINSLQGFGGDLVFTQTQGSSIKLTATVNTGTDDVSFKSLKVDNSVMDLTFNVQGNTRIGALEMRSGKVEVSSGKTLVLGGSTEAPPIIHSMGSLTTKDAIVNVEEGASVTTSALNLYQDGNSGKGSTLYLAAGSVVEVNQKGDDSSRFSMNGTCSIEMVEGSQFKLTDIMTVTGQAYNDTSTITGSKNWQTYHQQNTGDRGVFIFSNAHVEYIKEGESVFISRLTNSSLEIATEGATASINNADNTISNLAVTGGNAILAANMDVDSISGNKAGKSVTVNRDKTIDMAGGKVQISTREGVNATLTAKSDNALLQLQADTSFSISDMTLSGVKISATAGTEVVLSGVDTTGGVELAAGQFTMGDTVTLRVQEPAAKSGGYTASFSSNQLSGITLNNADGAATLTVDLGSLPASLTMGQTYDKLTITLYGFTMMDYEAGKGLIFAEDSWLGRLLADQGASEYVDSPEVAALANNNTVKVEFTSAVENGANVGTVIRITGLTIPEPATTTLGLVALAALVTRRRRK